MKKIIACTGYGGTGSSVISDLFKEFNTITSFGDFEFRFLQDPGGIKELEFGIKLNNDRLLTSYYIKKHIDYIKSLKKYNDFFNGKFQKLSQDYIENIVDVSWSGYWHQDIYEANFFKKIFYIIEMNILRKIFRVHEGGAIFYPKLFKDKMYYSSGIEFDKKTKQYISNLIDASDHKGNNYIVFDQLVPASNAEKYIKYFDNIKIIIVDRDPRDLYLLNKVHWKEKWIPSDSIETYISWYKNLRINKSRDNNILHVRFEDFIFNYDKIIPLVCNFCNVDLNNHVHKFKYFDPEVSIKNVNLAPDFPEYSNDIVRIERELNEYCYPFTE